MKLLRIKNIDGSSLVESFNVECPLCHRGVTPQLIAVNGNGKAIFCDCPTCYGAFICGLRREYSPPQGDYIHLFNGSISYGNPKEQKFSQKIKNTSPLFSIIYNEAFHAEQLQLMQICGVGYRKSLEFLIKDYCIYKNPDKKDVEVIKKIQLSQCINEYVENKRIKEISEKAAWLGNDETHYTRKWEDFEIEDLKTLLNITATWIDSELHADEYLEKMTSKK